MPRFLLDIGFHVPVYSVCMDRHCLSGCNTLALDGLTHIEIFQSNCIPPLSIVSGQRSADGNIGFDRGISGAYSITAIFQGRKPEKDKKENDDTLLKLLFRCGYYIILMTEQKELDEN